MEAARIESLEDIRREIDSIDRDIVGLLGRRSGLVKRAASFKKDQEQVKAPERVAAMMMARRTWAREAGLGEDFVEELFRRMVQYFIAGELEIFSGQGESPQD